MNLPQIQSFAFFHSIDTLIVILELCPISFKELQPITVLINFYKFPTDDELLLFINLKAVQFFFLDNFLLVGVVAVFCDEDESRFQFVESL